jgi:hypothetical protein
MFNKFVRSLLFVSSFFPLEVVSFLLLFESRRCLAYAILVFGILGLGGAFFCLSQAQKISPLTIDVAHYRRRDDEAMSYIVTYLVPFLGFSFSGWQGVAAVGIFFATLAILYINSNMIHINPMLNLVGYHLYEITTASGKTCSLLTRKPLRKEPLSVIDLAEGIYLEKRR